MYKTIPMSNKRQPTYQEAVANVDKWIRIQNAESDEATIDIEGPIGEDWFGDGENTTKAIRNKLKEMAGLKVKKIIVNINSLGGQVNHGIGIHDVLATHKAEIETNVTGMTASAATVIAQAGDIRKMSDNALYLIHQPWSIFISNVSELEDNLESLKKINDSLLRIYTKRSGQPESKIRELMDEANGNGKWIDADEAKEMGLIDEIYEPMKAAASIKEQIKNLSEGPDALLNKLPEIPNSKIQMKNVSETTEGSEAAMTVTENEKKGLSAMIATARKFFGPSEEEETEETAEASTEETTGEAEETESDEENAENTEETNAEETNEDPEEEEQSSEDAEEDEESADVPNASAQSNIEARLDAIEARNKKLEDENASLKGQLAKADAGSTKIDGPEGQEGTGAAKSAEQEMLDADLAKLKATWNGEE